MSVWSSQATSEVRRRWRLYKVGSIEVKALPLRRQSLECRWLGVLTSSVSVLKYEPWLCITTAQFSSSCLPTIYPCLELVLFVRALSKRIEMRAVIVCQVFADHYVGFYDTQTIVLMFRFPIVLAFSFPMVSAFVALALKSMRHFCFPPFSQLWSGVKIQVIC